MVRIREQNINLLPGFWDDTWKREPEWYPGFGIDPVRFRAMADKIKPGDTVLDVGGGRGEFLEWLPADCQKWFLDNSKYAVAQAANKGVKAYLGSCYALPFLEGTFDVVVCAELIEHLEKPEECIYELKRVCKTGGYVSLTTPYELRIEDKQHIWSFSISDIQRMMGEAAVVEEVGNHIVAHWHNVL